MQKISPEIPYGCRKIANIAKAFHSVMTSAAMFTHSQNPSNFVRIEPVSR